MKIKLECIKIPYIESGDFKNIYTYYFDDSLDVNAIKFQSTFFDSQCVEGALTKEIIAYLNLNKIENKKILYYDNSGNIIEDTTKCINNYELDERIKYKSFYETPLESHLPKSFRK
jgi:hypothetical protein